MDSRMDSRARMRVIVALPALPLALAGRGAARAVEGACPEGQALPAPFAGETYVAATSRAGLFVAVVLAEATAGTAERAARAYLCNGPGGVDEWLAGTAAETALDLRSDRSARLEGSLVADRVTGTATLPDGEAVAFAADPATGIAGFYAVVATADRRLLGASAGGGLLEGLVAPEPATEPGKHTGHHLVVGIVTPPEGQPVAFTVYRTTTEPGDFRWIVLGDGRITGVGKTGTGVSEPLCEPSRPRVSTTAQSDAFSGDILGRVVRHLSDATYR